MSREAWAVDDIVQISPTWDEGFGGALLVVTEAREWGVQGYVVIPERPTSASAFYRLPYESNKEGCSVTGLRVGRAHWLFHETEPTS